MSYDLKREEETQQYVENLGIEYRFGCYKENNPKVCHLLGEYLESIKKDFPKAAAVFKNNCMNNNHGPSCTKYGNYAVSGRGREKREIKEGFQYYEKGCELNDPLSCLLGGMLLTMMDPNIAAAVPRDVTKGYNYIKKSCDSNQPMACHHLSGMFLTGMPKNIQDYNPHNREKNANIDFVIKPDMSEAFKYAKKGCELGNFFACVNVSVMYKRGDGVEKNLEESKKYEKIAENIKQAEDTARELKFQQGLDDKKK